MGSEILIPAERQDRLPSTIELPAPTAWPIVLAFGLTLVFAGLVTSASVSILGAILTMAGCVGWFRDVLPHEKHESVPAAEKVPTAVTSRPQGAPGGRMCNEQRTRGTRPWSVFHI